ncbi:hypothetical protein MMC32_004919 [Xylographa parallela]|nr:hypothetical protein [Xylographa parallela]
MSKLTRFVFLLLFVCCYALGPADTFKWSKSYLQKLIGSTQVSEFTTRPLTRFSPTTNCTRWLENSGDTIVYSYGIDETSSGARALRDCLYREEAKGSREVVRKIELAYPLAGRPSHEQRSLFELVEILPNLESISYNMWRVDDRVFSALKKEQSKYNGSWTLKTTHDNQALHLYVECSDSVKIDSAYGTQDGNAIDPLYKTLLACPTTKSLSLSVSQGGCTIGNDPWSFNWKAGDRFPDLEDLTLSGYDWESQHGSGWATRRPSSIGAWKAAMNWSLLKRLNLDRPPSSFLEAFRGKLHSLDTLVLRPQWGFWGDEDTFCASDEAAEQLRGNYTTFIAALPPLRELSISGMGKLLNMTPILEAHGPSLRKLGVHEFERDCAYESSNATLIRPFLNLAQIDEINTAAPNLESLSLDVYRSANRWPTKIFKALTAFANLSNLTMYFDLEDAWRTRRTKECYLRDEDSIWDKYCTVHELMQPTLNQTAAQTIFHDLRLGQPSMKLQNVVMYVGDFERREGGGMRYPAHDEHNKPMRYECWLEKGNVEICNEVREWSFLYDDDAGPGFEG